MKLVKVFDIQHDSLPTDIPTPEEISEISHKLNGEYHGNGNDSYYSYYITDKDETGYLTEREFKLFNAWLLQKGATDKEEVIISHWW